MAFKAYEIEELADRWFFRPAGALFAYAAWWTPMSPNQLTLIGLLIGVAAGLLLYWPSMGLWAFGGLILHSIVDSADGQLARLKNQFSLEGRLLDGVGGYFTHIAIFLGILGGWLHRGGSAWFAAPWLLSGLCCALHASQYDYHRGQYQQYAIKGRIPVKEKLDTSKAMGRFLEVVYGDYEATQRKVAGLHAGVEDELARRFGAGGEVSPAAREAYRRRYYWPVRGWNFLGDNTRFYAIGAAAWLGRPELFVAFVLTVMNTALAAMWLVQRRADRAFLKDIELL